LKGHYVADRGAPVDLQVAAVPNDDQIDEGNEQSPAAPQEKLTAVGEQLLAHGRVVTDGIIALLPQFPPEGPDDADASEGFPDSSFDVGFVLTDRPIDRPHAA